MSAKKGGKPTDGLRKMRMTTAMSREKAPSQSETVAENAPVEARHEETIAPGMNAAAKEKRVRITVDATRDQHRRLKVFAMDAETDGMSVMRALLDELDADPELASRIRERLAGGG